MDHIEREHSLQIKSKCEFLLVGRDKLHKVCNIRIDLLLSNFMHEWFVIIWILALLLLVIVAKMA